MKKAWSISILAGIIASWSINYIQSVPLPHPWEPYTDNEQDANMRQVRIFHDTFFSGIDVAMPMINKMTKSKWEDYRQKYHGTESKAGKAGRARSSEESNSDEIDLPTKSKSDKDDDKRKEIKSGSADEVLGPAHHKTGGGSRNSGPPVADPAPVAPVPPQPPKPYSNKTSS